MSRPRAAGPLRLALSCHLPLGVSAQLRPRPPEGPGGRARRPPQSTVQSVHVARPCLTPDL